MYRINEQAGRLNERITITREVLSNDGHGGKTKIDTTVATLWAAVMPVMARERDMGNQRENPTDYRFTVRRSSESAAVLEKDRITWRNKTMRIEFIADKGPKAQYMTFDCIAGVAA